MTLRDLFDLSLLARRDAPGLEFGGREYTFGELEEGSNRMAAVLAARGFEAGDRLPVYLKNGVETILLYLACVKLGVIYVPINILYRGREIDHILSDAEPKAVVADAAIESKVPVWRPETLMAECAAASPERPPVTLDGDAPAAIVYTSGTTGASKGAVLTHNN